MAKRRKNNKKKHSDNQPSQDFMADVPESDQTQDWEASQADETALQQDAGAEEPVYEEPVAVEEPIQEQEVEQSQGPQSVEIVENSKSIEEDQAPITQEELVQEESLSSQITIGKFLKEKREERDIHLKNIAQSTKISITNLENLESDNLEALPDKAYVTGYVKSYSKLLNLDINECIDILNLTYESFGVLQRPQEIVIPQAQTANQVSETNSQFKIILTAVIGIVVVIVIGVIISRSNNSTTEQEVEEVEEVQESVEITPQTLNEKTPLQENIDEESEVADAEEEIEQEAVKETEKEEIIKKEPKKEEVKAEVKDTPKKEAKVEKEEKEDDPNKPKRKFYKMAETLYTFDRSLSQEQIDELLPARFKVAAQEGVNAIFITAVNGDSWLTYKSDDEPIKKFVLKKGRSLLIRSKVTQLFLGNIGAVKVFLDNMPLNIRSSSGVKSIIFPQSRSNEFVTPLFIYKKDGSVMTSKEYLEENPQ